MTVPGPDNRPDAGPSRSRGHASAKVEIGSSSLLSKQESDEVHRLANAAIAQVSRGGEVRVRLIEDSEMAAAHLRYSNVEGTTDVLTFDLSEGQTAQGHPLDVDILVCADEARRQAGAHAHSVEREVVLYILHGVMHCLGHDDHTDDGFARMHAEEDRILAAIGAGPTFYSQAGNSTVTKEPAHG